MSEKRNSKKDKSKGKGKKKTTSVNGKGDRSRVSNHQLYRENWEKIFAHKEQIDDRTDQQHDTNFLENIPIPPNYTEHLCEGLGIPKDLFIGKEK